MISMVLNKRRSMMIFLNLHFFSFSSLKPFLISFGCSARPEVFHLASNHARSPRHRKHIAYRQRVRGDDQEWLCMDSYGWLLEAEEIWENAFGLKPLPSALTLIDSDCRWLDISMLDWRWPLAVARQVAQTCSFTMRAIWWISVFTLCAQQRTVQFCHVLKLAVMSDLPKHPWTYRKRESIWAVMRFCEFRITFEHAVSFPTLIMCKTLPMRLRMGWSVVAIWNQICLNFNKRAKMLMNLACTYLQNHLQPETWNDLIRVMEAELFRCLMKKSVHCTIVTRHWIFPFFSSLSWRLILLWLQFVCLTDSEFQFARYSPSLSSNVIRSKKLAVYSQLLLRFHNALSVKVVANLTFCIIWLVQGRWWTELLACKCCSMRWVWHRANATWYLQYI